MKLTREQLEAKQRREQLRIQREQVEELEIKARFWEAQWRIRHYTLEAEKLQPEYNKFLEAEQKKTDEAMKRFQEQIEAMNKATQESNDTEVLAANLEFLDSLSDQENSLTTV